MRCDPRFSITKQLPEPNRYVQLLAGEFAPWAYDEAQGLAFKGNWRKLAFNCEDATTPLDLEIGPGNGTHFAHYAAAHPDRLITGIELRYKPLIQAIRRAVRNGSNNARMVRYNALKLTDLFGQEEINNVFIHFPDPWPKKRHWKHRLINNIFLQDLFVRQQPGSIIDFKTDSRDYFDWALEIIANSPYRITAHSYDLHQSPFVGDNFVTQFESIFVRQNIPINWACLSR